MARQDGRTKRSVFATDEEWAKLRLVASKLSVEREGERVGPSDALWILVDLALGGDS